MARREQADSWDVTVRFGGGINSRASADEINPREAVDGLNRRLDLRNTNLRNRPPFDLAGTTPNGAEIRGFFTLRKSDGTVSFGVQSGANVYSWDGVATFTLLGTVNVASQLRGPKSHIFQLDDKVLISDLAKIQPVMEWDGTTFAETSFSGVTGDFISKYIQVANERAWFANVISNGVDTPHLVAASELQDYTTLNTTDRPSSSATAADPFQLPVPDLKAINGFVEAFGIKAVSTEEGEVFKYTGQDKTDFQVDLLYPNSAASGDESMVFVGNDIAYGRAGRIELLSSTDRFGDVETDDLSIPIADQIEDFKDWCAVYNERFQNIYFIPGGSRAQVWVAHKPLINSDVSPWDKWTTSHSSSFNPTAIMTMFDPTDGLEYVFFGDASGNIYRLEGSGTSGDGGTSSVTTRHESGLFSLPREAVANRYEGYVRYRANEAATLTLTMLYQGRQVSNVARTVNIAAVEGPAFGGDVYFGGDFFFNAPFAGRLTREVYDPAGGSEDFQLRVEATGLTNIEINEVGLRAFSGGQ